MNEQKIKTYAEAMQRLAFSREVIRVALLDENRHLADRQFGVSIEFCPEVALSVPRHVARMTDMQFDWTILAAPQAALRHATYRLSERQQTYLYYLLTLPEGFATDGQ